MLAFVAIIVAYGMTQPSSIRPLVSKLPSPSKPLLKPEPKRLLTLTVLTLSPGQKTEIQKLESQWEVERTKFLTAMSQYSPKQGRADQLSGQLAGFSELSRQFDQTRNQYWNLSVKVLTLEQKAIVEGDMR